MSPEKPNEEEEDDYFVIIATMQRGRIPMIINGRDRERPPRHLSYPKMSLDEEVHLRNSRISDCREDSDFEKANKSSNKRR
ncbi:hypothetical protein CDAR_595281 [Caerostris darwini]|uniref:Uncharacterized protein n=1 Tax=Caerostris darwini TaxID=1538125 RepID=A0AAV4MDN8_9ARAC|nr:hypothetical protein CDAR_595281 [Caerostris darwini]